MPTLVTYPLQMFAKRVETEPTGWKKLKERKELYKGSLNETSSGGSSQSWEGTAFQPDSSETSESKVKRNAEFRFVSIHILKKEKSKEGSWVN